MHRTPTQHDELSPVMIIVIFLVLLAIAWFPVFWFAKWVAPYITAVVE